MLFAFPAIIPPEAASCKPLTSDHVSWLVWTTSCINTLHVHIHKEGPERKLEQPTHCPTLHVASLVLQQYSISALRAAIPRPTTPHHLPLYQRSHTTPCKNPTHAASKNKTPTAEIGAARTTDIGLRPLCLPHLVKHTTHTAHAHMASRELSV